MVEYKDHTLKPDEVAELNRQQGLNLDESPDSLYIIRFLWNNHLNKAYQPHPFRVMPELNDHLVKDAIGMPYIIGPDPNEHLEGEDKGLPNTAESLLKIQADYSIGDIKKVLKSETDNFYGIIKVYPGYHEYVLNEKEPPLVSPTFDGKVYQGQDLTKADFLNLSGVNSGGYPVALTNVKGVCKNGIKQCMSELSVYAAAGSLKESRKNNESFSSTILKNIKGMSNEGDATSSLENVAKDLDATKQEVVSLSQSFNGLVTKVDAIATKVGVDTKGAVPPAQAKGPETLQQEKVDISNHPDFLKLKGDFSEMKKLSDKREKQISEEQAKIRVDKAASIVEMINKGKKLTDEEKETQVKQWVEKQDVDGNLENLDLIESTLKVAVPKSNSEIAAATGPEGFTIPGLNADEEYEPPKNSSIMAKTTGRHT